MVERLLKMLDQFLISNQTLKLDETFKVYLKVLSIDHTNFKKTIKGRIHKKRTSRFYRKHYGARIKPHKKYNYFWALDVPDSYPSEPSKNIFKNKCLISATVLALLQNEFYKSNRKDTRFLHLQNINSICKKKQKHAGNLLVTEINNLLFKTKLPLNGPYDLENTVRILHLTYNCQFFIFDGIDGSNKLKYLYPSIYNDNLIPIYLFEPHENPNHVVFIRNVNSYFKSNVKICFACKRQFSTYNYKHFCKEKKSCFSCRRFFASKTTYVHEKLISSFCDKDLCNEIPFTCQICNVTCYSKHCFNGHKLICTGQGTFGYKCLKCKKFTYRYGNKNGTYLKNNHVCGEHKNCTYCRKEMDDNHLCPLIKEICKDRDNLKLAFIGMEFFDTASENCIDCFNLGQTNDKTEDLYCSNHKTSYDIDLDPILAIVYECKNSSVRKYVVSCFGNVPFVFEEDVILSSNINIFNETFSTKTKETRKSNDFKRNLTNLQNKTSFFLTDKLVQLITQPKWRNTTFICQDFDSKTYMVLLKTFVRNGICPVIVRNGRKILVLEIKALNLRFITTNSYFEGTEVDLAKQYNIQFDEYFFPKKFLLPHNLNYQGQIPDCNYFYSIADSAETRIKKEDFVNNFQKWNFKWNLQKELIMFCDQKLLLLLLACYQFINYCISFQKQLNIITKENMSFLNPFSYPLCSLGGLVYKLFKLYYLNKQNIYVVKNEFGINCKNVSKIEYEWASFMDHKYPEKKFIFAFNNDNGQKYFKEAIPDLYSPITKEAYFFNGCVFHGHYDNCLLMPTATPDSKNPFGKTYQEINEEFFQKVSKLLANNDISEVIIHWECQYKQERESEVIQLFLKEEFKFHPLIRLRPRSCVRGAFFDVYSLKWSKELFPNEKMYFLDVNGLYSFCAIKYKYMIGKYQTAIGKTVKHISFINNQCFYKSEPIVGSMLVTIIPPNDLLYPFLLYRCKNGKTVNTLCSKCCENQSKFCNHNDMDRALTACYMISEIEFALKLNYKLVTIHECHYYLATDYILKDFIQILNFFKTKHSDCLEKFSTETKKVNYCNFLNSVMTLKEPFVLKPSEFEFNKSKRTFFKLMANSLFGKLEQKQNKSKTLYVSNQNELEKIFFSEHKIDEIFCLTDDICQVQITPNESSLRPNRKSNCYIGAQVTAYARQTIYEHIQTLLQHSARIYQVDCDSIIFSLQDNLPIPLDISDAVGHFKKEIKDEIVSFYSLGPKNYSLTFCNNNTFETVSKVCGLSIGNSFQKDLLNDQLFDFYLSQFLNNKKEQLLITQKKNKSNFKKFKVSSILENVIFSNNLSKRRYVLKSKSFSTFPYGFKEI
jgi:hypothetical protein